MGFTADGFRATNWPLQYVLVMAFDLKDPTLMGRAAHGLRVRQITGAPDWVNSDPYDIQAKTSDQVAAKLSSMREVDRIAIERKMLQNLLTERFGIKFHFEQREMPAYNLIISKAGIKGMKVEPDTAETRRAFGETKRSFTADTMADVCESLTRWIEAPVVDHTGLNGKYDLVLEWSPDQLATNGDALPPYEPGSYIRKALEDHGLILQPTKTPIPELVIDHIERPSEN